MSAGGPVVTQTMSLTVNGSDYQVAIEPHWTLLQFLRDELGLAGTKDGCRQGACGSCTVLVDGLPTRACLALAIRCRGKRITTVEGLKSDGKLHRLQQAFIEAGAVQCGFCTPGILLTSVALLEENPSPTEEEVREALIGNLCRCTGYVRILRAVMAAGATSDGGGTGAQP
jgi:carbon-monoxide dehydrogenase small subunit